MKRFDVKPDMTNNRFRFLDVTITNVIASYLESDWDGYDKYIEKYDNVLSITVSNYADGYYYFMMQANEDNRLLLEWSSDYATYFLYDRTHTDLVLLDTGENLLTVVNTVDAKIVRESTITSGRSLFDIQDQLDESKKWVRQDQTWSYSDEQLNISLDIRISSLVILGYCNEDEFT